MNAIFQAATPLEELSSALANPMSPNAKETLTPSPNPPITHLPTLPSRNLMTTRTLSLTPCDSTVIHR